VVGGGEELERAAAGSALEIVFHDLGRPVGIEEVAQRASAFIEREDPFIHKPQKAPGEFKVLARFFEYLALQELVALRA
jgi:hypothetical protein